MSTSEGPASHNARPLRPFAPCQLEIPIINENSRVHSYTSAKKYGEPKLPGANIRTGVTRMGKHG